MKTVFLALIAVVGLIVLGGIGYLAFSHHAVPTTDFQQEIQPVSASAAPVAAPAAVSAPAIPAAAPLNIPVEATVPTAAPADTTIAPTTEAAPVTEAAPAAEPVPSPEATTTGTVPMPPVPADAE